MDASGGNGGHDDEGAPGSTAQDGNDGTVENLNRGGVQSFPVFGFLELGAEKGKYLLPDFHVQCQLPVFLHHSW